MKKESGTQLSDGWKTVVAKNFEEIEAIRPIWEQMQCNEPYPVPNADIDRYLSVVKMSCDSVQPFVMLMKHNGFPAAMIIGRIEKHQINLRLGYKTLLKPALKCLSVVYGGILGQPKSDLCSLLVDELMRQLRSGEVDMVFFNHLRTNTHFYRAVREIPSFLNRGYLPKVENHWYMSVPETLASFYQSCSASSRKQYKKCIKRLERAFLGQVRVQTYSQENHLDEAIKYASQISTTSYQYSIGCGFMDNSHTRTLLATSARKKWLRIHVLFVGDEACAFEVWLKYGRTYFGDGMGFDPKWKKWRVGTVLFLKTIESICADPDVDSVDFGFGDAAYKRSYGSKRWDEASVYIFAMRLYPAFINVLQSSIEALNLGFEYVVKKIGAIDWIKRRWRNMLLTKNPGSKRGMGK
jgi:hypothetical protein